ncbi:MAG: hypothetical protein BVN31_02670 [Proteobacteria bacterium ST_bin15]|nr:MAG: hypothetical protein BVN31_02670 [Proteobacteria bacterium ST_bin15]
MECRSGHHVTRAAPPLFVESRTNMSIDQWITRSMSRKVDVVAISTGRYVIRKITYFLPH